jgi:uncharacterized protein (TIRG00374 family)
VGSSDTGRGFPWQLPVGLAVSAFCLWTAFRRVPLSQLMASLKAANYWWLLLYPVLGTALNMIRGEIWRRLLRNRVGSTEAFWAYGVGFLVNNVLPFRLGEAARVVALSARRRLPIVEVAAAAALERVLDLVALLVIVVSVLPFVTHSVDVARGAVWSAGLAFAVLTGLAAVVIFRRQVERLIASVAAAAIPRHADLVVARVDELMNGLAVVREPRVAGTVIGGAALVWTLTIILQWTVLRAFQPAAGLIDAAVMVAVVSVGGAIPAAPGALGTYQWVGQQSLTLPFPDLYSPTLALAIAVVSHAASYVFSTLLGACGLWYLGVPLSQIRGRVRLPKEPALESV